MNPDEPGFWKWLAAQFEQGRKRFGDYSLVNGKLTGSPEAIAEFKRLAAIGARAKGFIGTDEQCLEYWLNLINASKARKAVLK